MTNRRFKRLISEVMAVAVMFTSLQGVFCEDVTTEKTYEDEIYIEEAFEEEEVNVCGEEAEDAIPEDEAEDAPSETRKSVVDFFPGIEDDGMKIEDSAVEDFINSVRLGEDEESVSGNSSAIEKAIAKLSSVEYSATYAEDYDYKKYYTPYQTGVGQCLQGREDVPCLLNLYDGNNYTYYGEKIFYKEEWLVQTVSAAQLPNYYFAFLNRGIECASDSYKARQQRNNNSYNEDFYNKDILDKVDSVSEKYKNLPYFTRPEIRVYKTNIPYIYRVRITAAKGHYILAWGVNGWWGRNTTLSSHTPYSNVYPGAWSDYGLSGDKYPCIEFNAYMPNIQKEYEDKKSSFEVYSITAFDDTAGFVLPYWDSSQFGALSFYPEYNIMEQAGSLLTFHPQKEIPDSEFDEYKEKYSEEISFADTRYVWYYPLSNTEENSDELLEAFSEDDLNAGHQEYLAWKNGESVEEESNIFFVTKKPKGYKKSTDSYYGTVYYNTQEKKVAFKIKKGNFEQDNFFSGHKYGLKKGILEKNGKLTFEIMGPSAEKLEVYSKKGLGTIKLESSDYREFIPSDSNISGVNGNKYKLWTNVYTYDISDSYKKGTDIIYYKVPYTDSKGRTKYKKYSFRVTIK